MCHNQESHSHSLYLPTPLLHGFRCCIEQKIQPCLTIHQYHLKKWNDGTVERRNGGFKRREKEGEMKFRCSLPIRTHNSIIPLFHYSSLTGIPAPESGRPALCTRSQIRQAESTAYIEQQTRPSGLLKCLGTSIETL